MQIRLAALDDTQAISSLFCSQVTRWQRMNEQGQVEDLPYARLSIYERWLHGGAWLSTETAAIWINHLLRGAGVPIVLEENNQILGYAEYYISEEAEPYQSHVHIGEFIIAPDTDPDYRDHLMQYLITQAKEQGRITAASTSYDHETLAFYQRYGLEKIQEVQQYSVPAQGNTAGFYKVSDHSKDDALQIQRWSMPIGRTESARLHWESLWPQIWHSVPQILEQKTHRRHMNASGHEAFICSQQQLYDPRSAIIYCWTPKLMSAQLMSAIRDWAHKVGYRTLLLNIPEKLTPLLGSDAEKRPYQQTILARDV